MGLEHRFVGDRNESEKAKEEGTIDQADKITGDCVNNPVPVPTGHG